METTNKLMYRDGREFSGTPTTTDKGKPCVWHTARCSRCGGAGGSSKWAHTGWTCFECGGTGKGKDVCDRLYTEAQLAKLNATAAKKQAKRDAAAAEKQAAITAERDARRGEFLTTNKDILALAASLNDEFINTMIAQCTDRARISQPQIDLITKKVAENTRKAAQEYVGEVGERRDFTVTMVTFRAFDSAYGRTYLHIMRDAAGNTIKYMGSSMLCNVTWEGQSGDYYPVINANEVVTFKATIKSHEEYNGEKQTVVARPKQDKPEPSPEVTE
jgi:hypothetical protein